MAKVAEASIGDYEEGMRACSEATKTWMNVSSLFFIYLLFMLDANNKIFHESVSI